MSTVMFRALVMVIITYLERSYTPLHVLIILGIIGIEILANSLTVSKLPLLFSSIERETHQFSIFTIASLQQYGIVLSSS